MTDRIVRVYKLEIEYPPGSDAPGWAPACWPEFLAGIKDRARRREAARRGFRWPREHLYLSASGAYSRAALLTWFGATVYVDASSPVTWPEWQDTSANGRDWEGGSTAARWVPSSEEEVTASLTALKRQVDQRAAVLDAGPEDPLDAAARYLYPAPAAEPFALSAADVREAMAGIYAEGEWQR